VKQQALRATLLTILAAMYLPVTLVTGILCTNIVEMNEHAPRFWIFTLDLIVIGGLTAAGFFGYWYWHRGYQRRESQKSYKLA
jgi:Mg2+ and Co2+ transporter CorA